MAIPQSADAARAITFRPFLPMWFTAYFRNWRLIAIWLIDFGDARPCEAPGE